MPDKHGCIAHGVKGESVDSLASRQHDHGSAAVQCVTTGNHLLAGLKEVGLTGGTITHLRGGDERGCVCVCVCVCVCACACTVRAGRENRVHVIPKRTRACDSASKRNHSRRPQFPILQAPDVWMYEALE